MKKYLYLFFALCVGAVVMSCKPNNDINDPNKYVVMAKLHIGGSNSFENEKIAESYDKIVAAMKEGGYAPGERVEIHISDTAQMIADLKAFARKVKSDVGSISGYFHIELTGCQSVYADKNDKAHPWKVYDIVEIGKRPNGYFETQYFPEYTEEKTTFNPTRYFSDAWVYGITTKSNRRTGNNEDTKDFTVHIDLNEDAGGDYIYPILKTDGRGVWNPQTKYITDVIVVYGGGEPKELKINGRTYRKACNKDLNDNAEGEYIWFYATYDYYDGRYLWLGGDPHDESGNTSCRVMADNAYIFGGSSNFSAAGYLKDPWNKNGYDVVERVVPAYNTRGVYQDEAEFNKGADGAFIKMILAYRKHN